ncbi:hypothetical protein ACFPYI_02080 [Halomarina salina]|uniref:DUF7344 domain-containing protein n=1 Tax=Halomarina salina TaxID=1872699 RepID=A0ABD5RIH7_9EURY|nr:hypothetical protein [Halomarina salina]
MGIDVPESWDPDDLSADEALDLMSRPRRRNVVYALLEADDETLTRDELVNILAAGRREKAPDDVEDRVLRTIAESLDHNHLPKLDEVDVVDYDRESNHVELGSAAEDVAPLLRFVPEDE